MELSILQDTLHREGIDIPKKMVDNLREINQLLWDTEDIIRDLEIKGNFGDQFIEHARLDAILLNICDRA